MWPLWDERPLYNGQRPRAPDGAQQRFHPCSDQDRGSPSCKYLTSQVWGDVWLDGKGFPGLLAAHDS